MSDRGRSRSRSPPRRGYSDRGGREGGHGGGGAPSRRGQGVSVLVRNLPLDTRPSEIRQLFEKYGRLFDVYLPKDFKSGRPKGFGFVEFERADDADEAIYQLDRREFGGREMTVVLAKEGRKPADQMRGKFGTGGGGRDGGGYRGGGSGGGRRRSRSRDRGGRGRSRSRSRSRSRDNRRRGRSPSRSRSRSPLAGRSPPPPRSRSRTRSPERMSPGDDNGGGEAAEPAAAGERSRSRSPAMEHAAGGEEA
ncbi:putative Serine/arginine-rich SC35-like splicing factor SCL30 [Nannochloris sp. 'desiccata']|nr:putative Serine/arginine-rich SC35-like splicing factor SCL30 [Chlorella desiccata (nom. nud.)]